MKRRDFCKLIATAAAATVAQEPAQLSAETGKPGQSLTMDKKTVLQNKQVWVRLACAPGCLWEYGSRKGGPAYKFSPPAIEVDGRFLTAMVESPFKSQSSTKLANGATEYVFESRFVEERNLTLTLRMQLNDELPLIRFRYEIKSEQPMCLGGSTAGNRLNYLSVSLQHLAEVQEIQLSNFSGMVHSNMLTERSLSAGDFQEKSAVMGPILAASDGRHSFVLAYEHGSQAPDAFLHYELSPDREVRLAAVKGNYCSGDPVSASHPYRTLWLETGAVEGGMDQLASSFRTFVLKYMAATNASREPLIFYNTWNFQERNQRWNGKSAEESMNEGRMLKEIDVAHKLGVDVFVIDAGWYEKTGDWQPDPARFPNGLKPIGDQLKANGMRWGLWFCPRFAASSSRVAQEHPEWRMSWNGAAIPAIEGFGADKKTDIMCPVSGYAEAFADELIRVAQETGATYFKWDMTDQYGCNSPDHHHGSAACTPEERAQSYGFLLPLYLSRIVDRISAKVPGAIVDFDVTERGRSVGLGFLVSGRFSLMNNGPYYGDYDIPKDIQPRYDNLFAYQGQARTWITRTPLTYDRWIPSNLFLTHYFPDDPQQWQEVNVASLMLGQNGIWGDLPAISEKGVAYIGGVLEKYKQVRDDITASDPVVTGIVSGSPEIHEKISAPTGRGVIVLFATEPGTYTYVTRNKVADKFWAGENMTVARSVDGRAILTATLKTPGAGIVIFGAQ
ncbi:MAG: alpha-galactosidase [Acidobacteriaceae bacterium]|nr:alpha-galactosidase [Acidobacteriaceae bacterium]